ncbi:MAG: hypothetical protein K9M80_05950 [Candidatus Marinimicrobia bacterium]|nr:hypothetical protein [Candidatus Neomarinimicrobiota bacterium]
MNQVKTVKDGELARKAIHYSATIIPLTYFFLLDRSVMLWITGLLFILFLLAELIRLYFPQFYRLYLKVFGLMIRTYEKKYYLTGATYVFLGAFLSIFFFPKEIAIIVLLFLTVGDPSACLVGLSIGQIKLPGSDKTLEGSLAFILTGLLVTFWIPGVNLELKIIGVLLAALIEYLPFRSFDDNLMIPLMTGTLMMIILNNLGQI